MRKLEGKSQHASLDHAFMDYSRALRANKRVLGSPHGYCSKGLVTSLDKPIGHEDDDGASVGDLIGMPGDDMELRSDFREVSGLVDEIIGLVKDRRVREEIRRIYLAFLAEQF